MRINLLILVIILSAGANMPLAQPISLHKDSFLNSFYLSIDSAKYFRAHVKSIAEWGNSSLSPDSIYKTVVKTYDTLGRETSSTIFQESGRVSYTDTTIYGLDYCSSNRTVWEIGRIDTSVIKIFRHLDRDANSRVISDITYINDKTYLDISYQYFENPSKIIETTSSPVWDSGKTSTYIRIFNKENYLQKSVYFEPDKGYTTYLYFKDSIIIEHFENDTLKTKTCWILDSDNNVTQITNSYPGENSIVTEKNIYLDGNLVSEESFLKDGRSRSKYIYTYNNRGLISKQFYGDNKPTIYTYEYYK